jgi:hypothetical protein
MAIQDGYVIEKPLGENTADNSMDSSLVVANADGSVLERLEAIQNKLGAVDAADNILGADNNNNGFASTNVVANNDGSIIERLEGILVQIGTPAGADISTDIASIQTEVDKIGTPTGADVSTDISNVQTVINAINAQVPKSATFAAADVLDGVQNALFTIAGGRVKIVNLILEVSGAAVDAGASNTKLISNPTVGTDQDICGVLDIDGDEEGTLYSITGKFADGMTGGSGGGAVGMENPIILAEGTIDILSAADSGTGGALLGALVQYIPLDTGATIVSA